MRKRTMLLHQSILFALLAFTSGYGIAATSGMEPKEEIEVVIPDFSGKSFQFAVRTGVGYFTGKMNEDVYDPRGSIYHVSHLEWDIDRLLMGKLGISMQYKEWLTIIADSWWKLSDGSGSLNDYDWLIAADWSHWSHSNADVTSASIVDVSANIAFFQRYNYTLQGILGFKRDSFEMLASGGNFVYSGGGGFRNIPGSLPDIPGIGYEQTMTSPYIGLGFSAFFSNDITISGRAIFSPLVKGEDVDHHYLRNLVTEDEISNGDMFAFDLSVGWAFRQNFIWNISAGYQKYSDTVGDGTYYFNNVGVTRYFEKGVGMGQEMVRISTGLTYTF